MPTCAFVLAVDSASELTAGERAATGDLLILVRAELDRRLASNGYTLGWNDQIRLHPHLQVIPAVR